MTRWLMPILLLSLAAGCGDSQETSELAAEKPLRLAPEDVAEVARLPLAAGVRVTGSLDAKDRVQVKAELTGQLDRVAAERGEAVARGQTLAVYDDSSVRAEMAEARAELAAAERDLEAAELLYREGAVSERQYVQAQVARESAQSRVTINREKLQDASVTAPIGGTVSERLVSSGEAVTAGQHLFTLVDTATLELAGRIPAGRIGEVEVGQVVELRLDGYPDREVRGRVARIESIADPRSRQVTVYIEVDNREHALVGGLFTTGTILRASAGEEPAPVPAIPITAVQDRGGQRVVFTVDGGVLERRVVELGARDEERGLVEVVSGLDLGATVVVAPTARLEPGRAVEVVTGAGRDLAAPPAQEPGARR